MHRPNILLFTGAAIALYAFMLTYFNAGEILIAIRNFNVSYSLPILLLIGMSYTFKYGRWSFFVKDAGVNLPATKLFPVFVASLSMLITPGKVGDVMKSYLLKKKFGFEQRMTLPSVFMERITDLPSLAILSVAGVYAVYPNKLIVIIPFMILALVLLLLKSNSVFKKSMGFLVKVPRVGKYAGAIGVLYANMQKAASYKNLLVGTLIGMVGWVAEGLLLYAVLLGLGAAASILLIISIYIISVVAGVVSLIPGGLGASEASMFGILVIAGISKPDALAATIIFRALTLWLSLATGSIALSYVDKIK